MKRYTELSRKYLSRRLRRTLYTLLGVALAVAFITAIMITFESIEASELQSMENSVGRYHGKVVETSESEIMDLKIHVLIEELGIQKIAGTIEFPEERASLFIEEANELTLNLRGKSVKEGRLPERPGEIALDSFSAQLLGITPETGQKVSLDIGGKKRTYEVVGIVSKARQESAMSKAFVEISPEEFSEISEESRVVKNAYFTVDAPNNGIRVAALKVASDLEIRDKTTYNGSLIYFLENLSPVNWPAVVLGLLVAVASMVSIYNTVQISVLERIREFGLLRAAGATPAQIRKVVFRESILVSLVGIPLGLATGVLLSFAIALYAGSQLTGLGGFSTMITPLSLLLGTILGFLSVVVSSLIPALRAGKVSPVEAMRQYGVEPSDFEVKGIVEGQSSSREKIPLKLAKRNMRRNLRTTIISVISMTMAATLFIAFSYFAGNFDTERIARGVVKSDFSIRVASMYDDGPDEQTIEEILSFEDVQTVAAAKFITGRLLTEYEDQDLDSRSFATFSNPEAGMRATMVDNSGMYMALLAYNDLGIELMKTKVISGSIDLRRATSERVIIIDIENSNRHGIEAGDRVLLKTYYLNESMVQVPVASEFVVAAVVQELPSVAYTVEGGILAACSDKIIESLRPENGDVHLTMMDYMDHYSYVDIYLRRGSDAEALESTIEEIADRYRNSTFISYSEYKKETEDAISTLSTLVYGLIAIVGFIGICGITNTINTTIILRRREFGILRAIGMTGKQLKAMLTYEGLIFGLISAVSSVVLGLILSYTVYSLLRSGMSHLNWSIPWMGIVLAVAGAIGAGILTTLASSRKVTSLSITESIRTVE
ncbi:FtsX-like permease family protein [Mesotoga sp. BH458_6_3_2_1]|uniref:FtsX-like permease family protein n=4 Tax=unclassified Mesotoga TaxID=1184398 RepID=UPI000EF28946|nr:ABC transporter permease [Mesotoga sp. BH458_6_3_2_1]RLL82038.1 ABC transporter permease [Mesotoga sp. BH458_6_3_2_1]